MPRVQFPSVPTPIVSVVVLAWRQTDRLIDCLVALADSADAPAFEVVLVLNGASRDVRDLVAAEVSGVVLVDVEANVGFGGGCNLGVSRARGTHLLFLNDDAVVDQHLLARLVDRLESDGAIAAVAAVLVNPDGTLQEAGSRVLSGAGTVQLGAGLAVDSAEAQQYLVSRDIDYGSAAALLVRKDAFDSIGGFDPVFEPAYFEDVDLEFRLKEAGWRVVLEPDARAAHASGSSTSADTRFRRFAADHAGAAFISRWEEQLPNAAKRDDPVATILPVAAAERIVVRPDAGSPLATAAAIGSDYAAWLARELDDAEAERERRELELGTELAEAKEQTRALEEQLASVNATAHALRLHLDDLESRSPVGVVQWRLGLRRQRRDRDSGE